MIKVVLGAALIAMITFGHADARPRGKGSSASSGSKRSTVSSYPTNGIFQEMSGTTGQGKISVDLLNSSDYRHSARFGMFGGEIMYTPNAAGASGDMLGYKHPINKKMAAYGLINFDADADGPDMIFGFAYSGGKSTLMYNVNAEILSPGGGGDNTTEVKAGCYYAINSKRAGRLYLAGEYVMNMTDETSSIYGALRFVPKNNVRVDVGVYHSERTDGGGGPGGGGDADSQMGIPVFFRLTLGI
jgi:hypothetical protein